MHTPLHKHVRTHAHVASIYRPIVCTTLSGVKLKLLSWLAGRKTIKGTNLDADRVTTSVRTVDINQICLVIRTQIGAEISICGVEMFTFDPQQITAEFKLPCQNRYLVYT